jgi:uncharacterized membrane protein
VGLVLALAASLLWGAADFAGGTLSRRLPTFAVLTVSQLVGVVVLGAAVLAGLGSAASAGYVPWALGAGVVGVVALGAFYQALAEGTMGVVAPIAASGVVVPVAVGLAVGDRPSWLSVLGLAWAVVGVVAAGGIDVAAARSNVKGGRPVVLALVAAVGFGAVITLVAEGSKTSAVMTVLVMRTTSVALLAVVAVVARLQVTVPRRDLAPVTAVGLLDLSANAAYAAASTLGLVSLVAVLASLYPAVTVLLARQVHHERLSRLQTFGVVAALTGVVCIGVGGV